MYLFSQAMGPKRGNFNPVLLVHVLQREGGEIIASRRHFPDFYTNQALKVWRSSLHALFHWNVKGGFTRKSEKTPPALWSLWALAYSRDRTYNFSYLSARVHYVLLLSAMSINGRFRSFFSGLGCPLARKRLSWPALPVSKYTLNSEPQALTGDKSEGIKIKAEAQPRLLSEDFLFPDAPRRVYPFFFSSWRWRRSM